jgi:hypothetical protein
MRNLAFFFYAVAFGFLLSRSGATDYEVIQRMFLLQDFHMYGFLGVASSGVALGLFLLKRHGRSADGAPLVIVEKPVHGGNLLGGALFGLGWSLTGMCPGPMWVNLGEGKLYAFPALAGALVGTWALGVVYPGLSRLLGLPGLAAAPRSPEPGASDQG